MKWRSKSTLPKLDDGKVYGRIMIAYFATNPIFEGQEMRMLSEIVYTDKTTTERFTHWMPYDEFWDGMQNIERE